MAKARAKGRAVLLSNGAALRITLTGDVLMLDATDRAFVEEIANDCDRYEQGRRDGLKAEEAAQRAPLPR